MYKEKYLKYKIKYIDLQVKIEGGGFSIFPFKLTAAEKAAVELETLKNECSSKAVDDIISKWRDIIMIDSDSENNFVAVSIKDIYKNRLPKSLRFVFYSYLKNNHPDVDKYKNVSNFVNKKMEEVIDVLYDNNYKLYKKNTEQVFKIKAFKYERIFYITFLKEQLKFFNKQIEILKKERLIRLEKLDILTKDDPTFSVPPENVEKEKVRSREQGYFSNEKQYTEQLITKIDNFNEDLRIMIQDLVVSALREYHPTYATNVINNVTNNVEKLVQVEIDKLSDVSWKRKAVMDNIKLLKNVAVNAAIEFILYEWIYAIANNKIKLLIDNTDIELKKKELLKKDLEETIKDFNKDWQPKQSILIKDLDEANKTSNEKLKEKALKKLKALEESRKAYYASREAIKALNKDFEDKALDEALKAFNDKIIDITESETPSTAELDNDIKKLNDKLMSRYREARGL